MGGLLRGRGQLRRRLLIFVVVNAAAGAAATAPGTGLDVNAILSSWREEQAKGLPVFQSDDTASRLAAAGSLELPWHHVEDMRTISRHTQAAAIMFEKTPIDTLNGVAAPGPLITPCWWDHKNVTEDGSPRPACIPGFYVLGVPKCGTTVLFRCIVKHPFVVHPFGKETHYWSAVIRQHDQRTAYVEDFSLKTGALYMQKIVDDKVEADWAKVAVGDFSPENFHLVTDPVSHDVEWQPWLWRQKLKSGDNAEGRLLDWAQWGSKHRWRRRGPDDVVTKGGVWGNGGKNLPAGGPWSDSSSYVDPKIQPGADATAGGGGESGAGDELDGPAWPVWARHVRRRIPLAEMVRYRQPGAKLIVSLRSPPERTASHYFMLCSARCQKALQNAGNDSAALEAEWAREPGYCPDNSGCLCPADGRSFHKMMELSVPYLRACIDKHGVALCALARGDLLWSNLNIRHVKSPAFFPVENVGQDKRNNTMRVALGWLQESLYAPSMQTWLTNFPRDQLLVLDYHDLVISPTDTLKRVFDHIGVGTDVLGEKDMWQKVLGNIRLTDSDETKPDAEHKASHGSTVLWPETGDMLRQFFAPHNRVLAEMLGDDRFLRWTDRTHDATTALLEYIESRNSLAAPYAGYRFEQVPQEVIELDMFGETAAPGSSRRLPGTPERGNHRGKRG